MVMTSDTIPDGITIGEVKMADFLCAKCGAPLQVSHGQHVEAMQGYSQCQSCKMWTPFRVRGGIYRIDESLMPVRICPNCKAKAGFRRRWEWPPESSKVAALDSCSACGFTAYFKSDDREGTNVTDMYPKVVLEPPTELPEPVKKAYAEALVCYGAGAPNGTLLMCRRAIQEALDGLGAKKGVLPTQLQDLVDKRKIPPDLKDWADHARIGGKLAGHGTGGAEWGDSTKVWGDMKDADAVIGFCDSFFDYLYVIPERNRQRRAGIDPIPPTPAPSS